MPVRIGGRKSTTFREDLRGRLRDPEFRREWEKLQPALAMAKLLIDARRKLRLSQRQLAVRAGVKYPQVARVEGAYHLPSIDTLLKLARGMDAALEVRIIRHPKASNRARQKSRRGRILAAASTR